LKILIDSILSSFKNIFNYLILLFICIYVVALLGMQFYAGRLTFNEDGSINPEGKGTLTSRASFDGLYEALKTVF
jgi:hypothetical protein